MNFRNSLHKKIATALTLLTLFSFVFATQVGAVESAAASVPSAQADVPAAHAQLGPAQLYNLYKTMKLIHDTAGEFVPEAVELTIDSFTANLQAAITNAIPKLLYHADWNAVMVCLQTLLTDPTPAAKCLSIDCLQKLLLSNGGLVPMAGNMVAVVGTRPNTVTLAAYKDNALANSFLGKTAYAQGLVGESLLHDTVLEFWKVMRNISYFAFVVVLIAVGFMIMFRYKLGPQTSVTLMNALPRVALSLVLVTFSYPIVALLLDVLALGFMALTALMTSIIDSQVGGLPSGVLGEAAALFKVLVTGGVCNAFIGGFKLALGGTAATILSLITSIAVIIALFMAVINFLLRFVKILLMTAFAPLILTWGAIPGNDAISGWFRGLAANILAMLGVWLFIMLGIYFWVALPLTSAWGMFESYVTMGPMITIIAAPIVAALVLFKSWSIPGAIEKAIAGKGVPGWYTSGGGGKR